VQAARKSHTPTVLTARLHYVTGQTLNVNGGWYMS
jgi:hypothetical protein